METKKSHGDRPTSTSEVTRAEGRSSPSQPSQPSQRAAGSRTERVADRVPEHTGPRIEHDGLLARGGMGAVHRVFDHHIRRYAAMKVLDDELASQPQARRRFLAEAQIAGQLDHPNIVPVYDLDLADTGTPRQFTMKLVDGVTLTSLLSPDRVAMRTNDDLRELLDAFVKVCDAVAFAHSRGVVHRDLKPDNVMLGAFGQVYVMDWGIARVVGAAPGVSIHEDDALYSQEEPGTILGSAPYMAPEQAWGNVDAIDTRTDVFALGGILYQILTGHPPYEGATPTAILQEARLARVRPPCEVAAGLAVSPSLERIALKALARAPEHRYADVVALKHDVEAALRAGLSLGSTMFRAGETILREGEDGDAAYIITSGVAVAYKTIDVEERALREMGPGEVFGEMALLSSRPRSASVVAKTDVTAIVVTKEALARELHAESWLAALVRTLVDRLSELDARVHLSSAPSSPSSPSPPKEPREK